jgi:Holliday junction resolvasome RuvABC endonuclease subunit
MEQFKRSFSRELTGVDFTTGDTTWKEATILTNDPSFTAWGWAVLGNKGNIIATGCIKTAPEQKKRRIRTSDDRIRRTSEIAIFLIKLIQRYNVKYILSESPHGSQNASAAVMIGIVAGLLVGIAESLALPIEWYSEQDSKKAVLGKKAATKEDMIEAIDKLYEVDWRSIKYIDEAVADALAVHYVASQQSPMLKMMKK